MQKPPSSSLWTFWTQFYFWGRGWALGKAGEVFVFYSWVTSSDLKTFHCLCRGNMQRLSVRSGHLSFVVSLTWDAEFPFREEHCLSWGLFQQHSLMLADGHCHFGHVSGRVACILPRQNALSSGSKVDAAGDITVADFIFDLNNTMCSLLLRATEIILFLNLRVSFKGKGSARFASSSVSSTRSQKSQWETTVTWSNIILFFSTNPFWDKKTKSNRPMKIHVTSQEQKTSKRTVFHLIGMARTSLFSEKRANQSHKGKTGPPSAS